MTAAALPGRPPARHRRPPSRSLSPVRLATCLAPCALALLAVAEMSRIREFGAWLSGLVLTVAGSLITVLSLASSLAVYGVVLLRRGSAAPAR